MVRTGGSTTTNQIFLGSCNHQPVQVTHFQRDWTLKPVPRVRCRVPSIIIWAIISNVPFDADLQCVTGFG